MFTFRRSATLGRTIAAFVAIFSTGLSVFPSAGVNADGPSLKTVNSREIGDRAERALNAYHAWADSRQPMAWVEFSAQRETLAYEMSEPLGTNPVLLSAEWANAPIENQVIVVAALSQLGIPYRYNSMAEDRSFDCSGLTKWAYEQAGVDLPRVSWDQIRSAERTDRDHAMPGDLVHYPGHIGLYLGQDGYIDAPNSGNVIRVHGLPSRRVRFGDATA